MTLAHGLKVVLRHVDRGFGLRRGDVALAVHADEGAEVGQRAARGVEVTVGTDVDLVVPVAAVDVLNYLT